MTVSDLASLTGTSVGSVVRFAQDLGLRGFQDLKLRLAAETSSLSTPHQHHAGSPSATCVAVLRACAEAITDASANLDYTAFERAAESLNAARHVLFVGVGTSAPLAQDMAYRFKTIGRHAEGPGDALLQHVAARLLRPEDVCVSISHTGQTRETLSVVSAAKASGATTIAVTSYLRSPLTALVDIAIVAGSAETAFQIEAMASRFAHLAVLDGLHAVTAAGDPERARYATQLTLESMSEHRL